MKVIIKLIDGDEMIFENADNGTFVNEDTMVRIITGNNIDYIPVSRIITMHVES